MKIKEKLSQNRRDFTAIYVCEHCEHTVKDSGYDDANFHNNVIPSKVCAKCGKKAPADYTPNAPVHPAGRVI